MKHSKPKRKTNRDLLDRIKTQHCFICGNWPSDPCHIKSVGSGGPDETWNVVPMCRFHHTEQHAIGWVSMWSKYVIIRMKLASMGWEVKQGKLKNWHN